MMHGNPTWGHLYRNFIGPVTAAGSRAIVPDRLGFGRSGKPNQPELCPQGEVADLNAEIEAGLEKHFRTKPVKIMWAMKDVEDLP